MPIEAGQKLSHYRLIEKIGEGGMGVVWKAEDTVLGRTVAIKVLPADVSRDEQRRKMFLQEAQLASQVSAAHVAQVHEFGREGDLDFIVMEYVEGSPLSKLLHGRPLPPHKVAEVGYQIAHALSRAHRKNLLHRDLKPANVIVTPDGEVKVLDFGLATLFERSDTVAPSQATTQPGDGDPPLVGLAGTLPYMSPEQARMEALDARSDVFSLGTMLYEMTTGQLPFTGPTSAEVLQSVQRARPKLVHDIVPQVPLELDRIIQKAMAPRRGDRYQAVEDLAVDLKRLGKELESGSSPSYEALQELSDRRIRRVPRWVSATLIGLAALTIIVVVSWSVFGPKVAPDQATFLIVPLEVRGQEGPAAYAGQAVAEGIAVNLSRAPGISVLPVPSALLPGGDEALDSARESAASFLLTGSIAQLGDRSQVNLNLVDVAKNRLQWGTQEVVLDGELSIFVSRAARTVLKELGFEALVLYDYPHNLSGSPEMADSPLMSALERAKRSGRHQEVDEVTRELVRAFPNQLDAEVFRSMYLVGCYGLLWTPETRDAVMDSVSRMRRLDAANPYSPMQEAFVLRTEGRNTEAVDLYTTVLQRSDLTPTMRAWALRHRGYALSNLGHDDAALKDLEDSIRFDPTNAQSYFNLSVVSKRAGRHDKAIERQRQAIALGGDTFDYRHLAQLLSDFGQWEEATPHAQRACELARSQRMCAYYALSLQRVGKREEALDVAHDAASMSDDRHGAMYLARIFALTGNHDESLGFLQRALDAGNRSLELDRETDFERLWDNPEFTRIATDMKRRLLAAVRERAEREPDSWEAQKNLGVVLAALERWDEASRAYGAACPRASQQSVCAAYALTLLRAGRANEARAAAETAAGLKATFGGTYDLACYYALAGDRPAAIQQLRHSADLGYASEWISRDPDLASLHGDPEFQEVVAQVRRRIGLE